MMSTFASASGGGEAGFATGDPAWSSGGGVGVGRRDRSGSGVSVSRRLRDRFLGCHVSSLLG